MKLKDKKNFLIDLDGVILDTKYDNYFWQNYIPKIYAQRKNISNEDAVKITHGIFNYKRKSKDWYDIDYWSNILNIDIAEEKKKSENMERMSVIKGSLDTLKKLKDQGINLYLITNAHRKTLEIKLQKFPITKYFIYIICSHELSYIKEDIQFWHILKNKINVDLNKTVLIEDTYDNIVSAHHAGIDSLVYISKNIKPADNIEVLQINALSDILTSL